MTTIAAIEGDGWAVIGADSQSSDESGFAIDIPAGKIFKNGDVIVAGAGAVRGINLLEHAWVSPAVKIDNIDKYVTSILIPSIRKCFDAADLREVSCESAPERSQPLRMSAAIKPKSIPKYFG
jgi:hypothetical protein